MIWNSTKNGVDTKNAIYKVILLFNQYKLKKFILCRLSVIISPICRKNK